MTPSFYKTWSTHILHKNEALIFCAKRGSHFFHKNGDPFLFKNLALQFLHKKSKFPCFSLIIELPFFRKCGAPNFTKEIESYSHGASALQTEDLKLFQLAYCTPTESYTMKKHCSIQIVRPMAQVHFRTYAHRFSFKLLCHYFLITTVKRDMDAAVHSS